MKKIPPGAVAALLATMLLAAPAMAGPTVTVRVEGQSATLLERTAVTLPDADSPICGPGKRWTVADAIDAATAGNWDRQPFTQTIMGETHSFTDSDYWAQWNGGPAGYSYSQTGLCDTVMSQGQEALMLVDRTPPPSNASTSFPLGLRGLPPAVQAGTPVHVSVVTFALDGSATPVGGATVSGGGASATTAADGTATLTFAQLGAVVVKASKPGSVVSAGERTTVSAAPVTAPSCQTSGTDGRCGTKDAEAPIASFSRLKNGKVFKHKRGPRKLVGSVTPDPSGLLSVRLSILRRTATGCWAFDGANERFEPHRCGGHSSFRIGDRAEWSYLLPKRLPKGRYTIRAIAIDNAGNDSVTRVVIRVR
jgi:hypothetical protein